MYHSFYILTLTHAKSAKKRLIYVCTVLPYPNSGLNSRENADASWEKGVALAAGQNFARHLKDSPGNKMTPTIFCEEAVKNLGDLPNIKIQIQ